MPQVVRFAAPRSVVVAEFPPSRLQSGQVRVRTLYSGISAGTEMTAYRGTNPYVVSEWDPDSRLFAGRAQGELAYPLDGWGYSEVGEVVEVAPGDGDAPQVGDLVWGIWGHRSEACLDATQAAGQVLPAGVPEEVGTFSRVGSVALNAVLAARVGLGSTVVVLGQGVIGLLATAFAVRSGAEVVAVDGIARRRQQALQYGAVDALAPGPEVAAQIRELTGNRGADVVIELSGSYPALHEATRIAGPDATVVAAGFYQGAADAVRLGEEFHHNRVSIVASQIGAVPGHLANRWTRERITGTVMDHLAGGNPDVLALVTHRYPVARAEEAYRMLDTDASAALQVLLSF